VTDRAGDADFIAVHDIQFPVTVGILRHNADHGISVDERDRVFRIVECGRVLRRHVGLEFGFHDFPHQWVNGLDVHLQPSFQSLLGSELRVHHPFRQARRVRPAALVAEGLEAEHVAPGGGASGLVRMRILRDAGAVGSGVRRLNLRGLRGAVAGGT